ncbi:MAG: MBL fold metallo-hydrolase [Actinomycetota bacterium]
MGLPDPGAQTTQPVTHNVHEIRDEALGNTSYLVAVDARTALVIDPRRDIEDHLAIAERLGVQIEGVLETHLHADFLTGAREIADATGATIYASQDAHLTGAHTPLAPGAVIAVGDATITVIDTPGHTPEHISYRFVSRDTDAVFSGGSLIVGGAARTDLSGRDNAEALARSQFRSLRKLAELPDDTALYPTHGAGSFCSIGPARSTVSTIGTERAANPALGFDDEDAFIKHLLSSFGSYPKYFGHLREVNRSGPKLLRTLSPAKHIDAKSAQKSIEKGAWLIDGRPIADWALAHPKDSVSIEVRPAFASWLGWVVPFGSPFVLVLEPERSDEAITLARRIGYDRFEGWTTFDEWRNAGLPIGTVDAIDAKQASDRSKDGAVLLDVRQDSEFALSHLPNSVHLELGDIISGKTPDARDVIAYCGHGERSATAASLLVRKGFRVANLVGGIDAWRHAGLSLAH